MCRGCPQGHWSKQWELRDKQECIPCAPGTVCPGDGIVNPCNYDDFPHPYTPLADQTIYNRFTCDREDHQFWGVLIGPIDSLGQGPYLDQSKRTHPDAKCYFNEQPFGSTVYQRFRDYYGPNYEL